MKKVNIGVNFSNDLNITDKDLILKFLPLGIHSN